MSQAQGSELNGGGKMPHVAILPSSGMGHLSISLRLAVALVSHGCLVTFITPRPLVSDAESRQISELHHSFPQIRSLDFNLLPLDAPAGDPFLLQWERIRRSASLLGPLLASVSPALSAFLTDISLLSAVIPVTADLHLPNYVTFISCSMMLALCAVFPNVKRPAGGGVIPVVEIPGASMLPGSWIPPPLHDPEHLFTTQFVENGRALLRADGIFINTFEALEEETLVALNAGRVVPGLPPVIAIGPQEPFKLMSSVPAGKKGECMTWLDAQPPRSVVYVAFGNRTALSLDQIRELGVGLEKSGCRFLWVVKLKVIDREEDAGLELEQLLGEGYMERVGDRGMVVKGWVDQEEVLAHGSVGGFLCHGGWNSGAEASLCGVRLLIWPLGGDQWVNAAVVEKCGLGVWKELGWSGAASREGVGVVSGEEIGKRLKEQMGDAGLGESVARLRGEAMKATVVGGSEGKGSTQNRSATLCFKLMMQEKGKTR